MSRYYYQVSYKRFEDDFPSTNIVLADDEDQVREYYLDQYGELTYFHAAKISECRAVEYMNKPGMPVVEL